jgi:hypothetical protein
METHYEILERNLASIPKTLAALDNLEYLLAKGNVTGLGMVLQKHYESCSQHHIFTYAQYLADPELQDDYYSDNVGDIDLALRTDQMEIVYSIEDRGLRMKVLQMPERFREIGDRVLQNAKNHLTDLCTRVKKEDSYDFRKQILQVSGECSRPIDLIEPDSEIENCHLFHTHLLALLDEYVEIKGVFDGFRITADRVEEKRGTLGAIADDIKLLSDRHYARHPKLRRQYTNVNHWLKECRNLDKRIKGIKRNRDYVRQVRHESYDRQGALNATTDDLSADDYGLKEEQEEISSNVIPIFRPSHPQVAPVLVAFMDTGSLYSDLTFCGEILDVRPSTERIKEWQDILTNADSTRTDLTSRFNDFYESLSRSTQLTKKELDFLKHLKRSVAVDSALETLCTSKGHLPDTVNRSMDRVDKILALTG